jgi:hypothetical protein
MWWRGGYPNGVLTHSLDLPENSIHAENKLLTNALAYYS